LCVKYSVVDYSFKDEKPSEWWAKFLDTETTKAVEQCVQCKELRKKISAIQDRSIDSKEERKSKRDKKKSLTTQLRTHRFLLLVVFKLFLNRLSGECSDVKRLQPPRSSLMSTDRGTLPQFEEKKIQEGTDVPTDVLTQEVHPFGTPVPFPQKLYEG
jgi:hypothetical protein